MAIYMVEPLPGNFVERQEEYEAIIKALLDPTRKGPVGITAALRGAGGYGKTTLARAVCHDNRVMAAFPEGILWVTLGEQPGDLTRLIDDLIYRLSKERCGYTNLGLAVSHLRDLMDEKRILLVVDDVWNGAHLEPFFRFIPTLCESDIGQV